MRKVMACLVALLATAAANAAPIIDKVPDVGPYWHPLSGGFGTFVYADSFVFTGSTGTLADTVGIYLLNQGGGSGDQFRIQLWADNGNSPNPLAVLGTTGVLQSANPNLGLVSSALLSPVSLTAGTRYWVVGTTVGLPDTPDSYQVGGHTQNSIYNDNGTFWYSNDPSGTTFDGQNLRPEMAIFVSGAAAPTPEPLSVAVFGGLVAVGGLVARRRRTA